MKDWMSFVVSATNAQQINKVERIQSLWSGYGELLRVYVDSDTFTSVILKKINWDKVASHPKGWNDAVGHERKLKSYQIELNWYKMTSIIDSKAFPFPKLIDALETPESLYILLTDLNAEGYNQKRESVSLEEVKACLTWLANFHGRFLGTSSDNLWDVGTYWHLSTRPNEFHVMESSMLKTKAQEIDERLNNAVYKTIVHGDAKIANFCFGHENKVAAVDFQYVGAGCGMKDVMYLFSSSLISNECHEHANELLDFYFESLRCSVKKHHPNLAFDEIQKEWKMLYPYAWADFVRFLKGWSPNHIKLHQYGINTAFSIFHSK